MNAKTLLFRVGGVLLIVSSVFMFLNTVYFLCEDKIYDLIGINLEYVLFTAFCGCSIIGYLIKVIYLITNLINTYQERTYSKIKTVTSLNNILCYCLMFMTIGLIVVFTFVLKTNILRILNYFTYCSITILNIVGGRELYGSK